MPLNDRSLDNEASGTSASGRTSNERPKRERPKRKRLIEDDDFNDPCGKHDLLSQALCRLKAVASSLALTMGHLFQVALSHPLFPSLSVSFFLPPLSPTLILALAHRGGWVRKVSRFR